ncbi:4'-phosphopantetheinyl transferase family protein [Nocardioides montaniterrae]
MSFQPLGVPSLLDPPLLADVAPGDPAVWVLRTDEVTEAELDAAREWLDAEERTQAGSYVRAELRRPYEIAHAATRRIIATALRTEPGEIRFGRHDCPRCGEPHGRPRIEGSDLEFSLSHTPGLVLVALADRPVGIDTERCPDPDGLAGLVGVLHPDEAEEVSAAPDDAQAAQRFTRAWTRTEAYLKGLGIGLGREPQADYLGTGTDPQRFIDGWQVRDIEVPEGYAAAYAVHVG